MRGVSDTTAVADCGACAARQRHAHQARTAAPNARHAPAAAPPRAAAPRCRATAPAAAATTASPPFAQSAGRKQQLLPAAPPDAADASAAACCHTQAAVRRTAAMRGVKKRASDSHRRADPRALPDHSALQTLPPLSVTACACWWARGLSCCARRARDHCLPRPAVRTRLPWVALQTSGACAHVRVPRFVN